MVDLALIEQQIKEIATQNAADLHAALFTVQRMLVQKESNSAVQEARQVRDMMLAVLHNRSGELMKGDAGKALQQRANTIKAYSFHQDGVNSVS